MKELLWVLTALLIAVYLFDTLRVKSDMHIIQTSLGAFKPGMLLEKYPIIIHDKVVDVKALLQLYFKYMGMWTRVHAQWDETAAYQVLAYFSLYHNPSAEAALSLRLYHPKHARAFGLRAAPSSSHMVSTEANPTKAAYLEVVLHPHQTLLVPTNWLVQNVPTDMKVFSLIGMSHWVMGKVRRLKG